MFKKKNLVFTGLLGLSMSLMSLTGCGSAPQPKDLLKAAQTNFKEVKNYDMTMDMVMSIDMKDQGKMDMTLKSNGSIIQSPELKYQLDSNIDMKFGDQTQSMNTTQYIIKEDSDYVMYMNMEDSWVKSKIADSTQLDKLINDPTANFDVYLDKINDITIEGEEKVADVDCYKIKVNLTKEYFNTVLDDMDLLSNMGLDEETLNQTIDTLTNADDLPMYYYVSKDKKQIVGMDADVSSLVKSIVLSSGTLPEDSLGDIVVSMHMTISNQNGVSDITLPEEAASAIETQLTE